MLYGRISHNSSNTENIQGTTFNEWKWYPVPISSRNLGETPECENTSTTSRSWDSCIEHNAIWQLAKSGTFKGSKEENTNRSIQNRINMELEAMLPAIDWVYCPKWRVHKSEVWDKDVCGVDQLHQVSTSVVQCPIVHHIPPDPSLPVNGPILTCECRTTECKTEAHPYCSPLQNSQVC